MTQSPCKDCPDRQLGCHSVCKRYDAYKAQKAKEAKLHLESSELAAYEVDRQNRIRRDHGWNMKRDKK